MITEDSWFWSSDLSVEMEVHSSVWILPTIQTDVLISTNNHENLSSSHNSKNIPFIEQHLFCLSWISQLIYSVRSTAARHSSTGNTNALITGFLLCLHSQERKYFNLLLTFVTSFSVSDHVIFIAHCLCIFLANPFMFFSHLNLTLNINENFQAQKSLTIVPSALQVMCFLITI